ncbi:MAG: 3-dehydroquinate synthase [Phycisphaerae bacterium]
MRVPILGREYPIMVARGARSRWPEIIAEFGAAPRICVIADARVYELHGERLKGVLSGNAIVLTVPPGEQNKSLASAQRLYDELARAEIRRGDLIVALGGGMVGDLAGFVAATWMRGIRFIQIPTTTEAAIDASVGGKTAVNHAAGKNLIGAFHQPIAVVIDTEFLDTLPERDFRAGLAESVKHAVTRDSEFLAWHEQNADAILAREPAALAHLIAWNCRIKAAVVATDERDDGPRQVLNHGHTIGHALEHVFGYALRHGECVALGMLVENELSRRRGLLDADVAQRIRVLLTRLGLPTRLDRGVDADAVLRACRMDKKNAGGRVRFVLLTGLGQTQRSADAQDAEITAALAALA